jgi:hypothetical protein
MEIQDLIQKDDNRYEAVIDPDIKYDIDFSLFGEGSTVQETIEDFLVSNEEMKELYNEEGKTYPNLTFKYVYDLPSFLQYYSKIISYAGLERLTGVNKTQLNQYVQGYRKPSKKTSQKIEKKLHLFAKELKEVHFI